MVAKLRKTFEIAKKVEKNVSQLSQLSQLSQHFQIEGCH